MLFGLMLVWLAILLSNEVEEEGADHMFFFNSIAPTGTPYNTYLSGSMTNIKYLDLDANIRGIGLSTLWTAPSMMMAKSPLTIELVNPVRESPLTSNLRYLFQ
jgi:hypothetical protein